ncbi:MAG: hypothetical protein A2756_02600 [Candidatus Ryanbacteria bacterium RIFCSPHIGHO2_01_FULL_48_27]|uniref:Peptidoglycan binding-like domain-containing protein n=1 Tax=Candidatus Ryanbacteria bacterium RIFCSPHIGHO2_01_FULL_48_27 TaxID=1802115 RepID=A0A1G2G6A4_9BACT|nr:MAG: hypothetical protein A2756_02600 [Candidatus Ryanbacteria bacterium RIFCSPHIGHO2_01_FULL_48_27]
MNHPFLDGFLFSIPKFPARFFVRGILAYRNSLLTMLNRMVKRFWFLSIFLALWCLPVGFVYAAPTVSSVSATPASISNGQPTLISWTLSEGTGHSIYFFCPAAVKIAKLNGTSFPCNTRQSINASPSTSETFLITNVSGSSQSIRVRVYPKDDSSLDYDPGSMDVYVSVGANPNPITDFTVSTTSAMVGGAVTLAWVGNTDLSGTNLRFDCVADIKVMSASPSVSTALPCNATAYANDLQASGSVSVSFANDSLFPRTVYVSVLPAIGAGSYDAVHGKSISFEVLGRNLPQGPSVDTFSSQKTTIVSGEPIIFSWTSQNTTGANLRFACNDALAVLEVRSTTTVALPCNSYAFSKILPASGSVTLSFTNKSYGPQGFLASIIPQISDGTYDATKGRSISLSILPLGTASAPMGTNTANAITVPPGATPTPTSTIKVTRPVQFSRYLQKGMKHSQVSELQKLLAQDKLLYPEGLVTGYFGPATDAALKRFQKRYGIAKEGDEGYGLVGPKTRAKLNTLMYF